MKKFIFTILSLLFINNLYSQSINDINIEDYKLNSQITSFLVEEIKNNEEINIYQENNNIYVLGWSKDGKIAFINNKYVDGRGGTDLYFVIQDLIEDKNVYYKKIKWYDNDNYGENPEMAQTFEQCILSNSKEFNNELSKNKIIIKPVKVELLPAFDKNNNIIQFQISNINKYLGEYNLIHMDYEIHAVKNGKYKILGKISNKVCDYVIPTGYIKSPYEDRIALIVANAEHVFEGDEVYINFYGCSLNAGYTMEK